MSEEPIRLISQRDLTDGIRRIRRRRWLFWVVLAIGFAGVVASRSFFPAVLLWLFVPNIAWYVLWWSRCPRCDRFFFTGFVWSPLFRRRCQGCGLRLHGLQLEHRELRDQEERKR